MEEHVVFPLFSPIGVFIGHQRYFWRKGKNRGNIGRYLTTILDPYKQVACYGWDNCRGFGPLFVTEGIFDAIRVSNCWVDCVACLCNNPSKQLKWLLKQIAGNRRLIALTDRDNAGEKLGGWCDESYLPAHGYDDYNAMSHDVCFRHISQILEK
jgi:hypothetical protein